MLVKYIHNTATSMINPMAVTNINRNQQQTQFTFNQTQINPAQSTKKQDSTATKPPSQQTRTIDTHQSQLDIARMVSNLIKHQPADFATQQSAV